ncbi:hypothetical protein [Mumia sp. Pv 4-285]|uniref:hypothetical protein n=1 Tax=Mumia qirimensis TaxID=3234852 RepID=UPI00351CD7E8
MRRYALSAVIAAALLLCLLEIWLHWDWIIHSEDQCDFPEACLGDFYPKAFTAARWLWFFGVLTAGAGLVIAALVSARRSTVLQLGVAGAATFVFHFLTPVHRGRNAFGRLNGGQPIGVDGQYAVALLLLALAAALYALALRAVVRDARAALASASAPIAGMPGS